MAVRTIREGSIFNSLGYFGSDFTGSLYLRGKKYYEHRSSFEPKQTTSLKDLYFPDLRSITRKFRPE